MRGLILLGLTGAGLWYAGKSGLLPQLAPVVAELERRANWITGAAVLEARAAERGARADAIMAASGGRPVPVLGPDEVVSVNKYEAALRQNMAEVSQWARANIGWAAAILKTENAALDPTISGDNGTSHGVGQVKVETAQTCARAGYRKYPATRETLLTMAGGIYFATAEMERLAGINPDLDWIIQAYNGGAGFEQMDAAYRRDRGRYLAKVKRNFAGLYGGAMA